VISSEDSSVSPGDSPICSEQSAVSSEDISLYLGACLIVYPLVEDFTVDEYPALPEANPYSCRELGLLHQPIKRLQADADVEASFLLREQLLLCQFFSVQNVL